MINKENPRQKEKKEEINQEAPVDYKDKWMRALAEYDNLKKRVEKEKLETLKFSNQLFIMELFPIMDSFDSAISAIDKSNNKESFLKGIKMIQGEFHRVLEVNGLKKMDTVGQKFDPNFHEAGGEVASDKSTGIIVEEIRSGYTLNERVLRPALVKVSKGKNTQEKREA